MRAERVTVPIGIRPDGNTGALAGHPGQLERLNVGLVPALQSDWSAGVPAFPAGSESTLERVGVKVTSPRRFASDGPITCIAIAPDSPIEACDLYIGALGGTVFRIAPGSPWIGSLSENIEFFVAPVRDTPPPLRREFMLATMSGDTQTRETKFWDMDFANNGAGAFGGTFTMPLRLDIYRGGAQSAVTAALLQKRARYTANMIFEVIDRGGAVASIPALNMIIDGRRRVRVVAGIWAGAGAAQLHIYGMEGRSNHIGSRTATAPAGLPLDWPVYDEMMAATALPAIPSCLVFDQPGSQNPYWAIQCAIEVGTIGTRGFVTVHAWDD